MINILEPLVPYFEGKTTWEKAISDSYELFCQEFKALTFVCESCGEIIFPNITSNEHGAFIESGSTDISCIKKNVCDKCVRKMNIKG